MDDEHRDDEFTKASFRASKALNNDIQGIIRSDPYSESFIKTASGVPIAENTSVGVQEAQQRRYFHGSMDPIEHGDYVVPGKDIGKDVHHLTGRNHDAYSIPSFSHGAVWARQGAYQKNAMPEHVYVHEVEPEGFTRRQRWIDNEWTSQRAKVVRRWAVPYSAASGNAESAEARAVEEFPKPLDQGKLF